MTVFCVCTCLHAVIDCGNAPDIVDGVVTHSSTTVGSTATYSCNTGFQINGESTRTCLTSRSWSGPVPICQRKLIKKT